EAPAEADMVIGVPDSSISAAIGYAEESGLPYEMGIIKNRYIGRTFIQPSQQLREQGVKLKLAPVRGMVEGRRIVMIDDSIVRGTTCKRIVHMLQNAGAREVHVRIASPPIQHPCDYGIDMSTTKELIAANHSVEEIGDISGADSIAYLSECGLENAIVSDKTINQGICTAGMSGNAPNREERQVPHLDERAGVDEEKWYEAVERMKEHIAKTNRKAVRGGLGAFAGLYDVRGSAYQEPVLASGTDGVGTKLKLAQAFHIHDSIGVDL